MIARCAAAAVRFGVERRCWKPCEIFADGGAMRGAKKKFASTVCVMRDEKRLVTIRQISVIVFRRGKVGKKHMPHREIHCCQPRAVFRRVPSSYPASSAAGLVVFPFHRVTQWVSNRVKWVTATATTTTTPLFRPMLVEPLNARGLQRP